MRFSNLRLASTRAVVHALLAGAALASTARADDPKAAQAASLGSIPLECRTVLTHAVPSTVCRPFTDAAAPVRVLFRKMPAWNGNSDLLLIDMCRYSPEAFALVEQQLAISDDGKLPAHDPRLRPFSCVRRYCTQKMDSFSIAVNALPIPIGWLSVSLWIGYQYRHFEVGCESLTEVPQ
jgi:hypothetical protein